MDLGGAVELGQSAGLFETSSKVCLFRVREGGLVGLDEVFECFCGTEHMAVSFPGFKALVGVGVQEVVLEAACFVGGPF